MADKGISLKHRFEYALVRTFQLSLSLLPLPVAYRLAESLMFLVQELLGWRKTETTRRIQQVFPEKSSREITRIRRGAGRNLADTFVEIARADSLGPAWMKKHVLDHDVVNIIQQARKHQKGLLLIIAHSGNWDLAGTLVSGCGIPFCFIARQQKNPLTYRVIMGTRQKNGGSVLDRDDPRILQKVSAHLQANEVVVILVDIRARGEGATFRFLDKPCRLSNGLGIMAARSGAPVLTVAITRDANRRHIWQPFPLQWLEPHGKKPARNALLQHGLDDLSRSLLENPQSYFWYNKRWVLDS